MAYSYVWPVSLPQKPNTDYSETGGVLIVRSPMDAGPAKQRKIGNRPQTLSLTFDMKDAQVVTFEDFVKTTLKGTARFGFTHPRLNETVEVRIIPSGDGQLYNIAYLSVGYWKISLTVEILP
jgi:hypothetical protein